VLLNQVGQFITPEQDQAECDRWRKHLAKFEILRDVLTLDAFTRCWVQEGIVLGRVRALLPDEKRSTFDRLLDVWLADHRQVFADSIRAIADHLASVAALREPIEKPSRRTVQLSVKKLTEQIQQSQRAMFDSLLALHKLDGHAAAEIRANLDDYLHPKKKRSEWLSGAIAGAGSGLLGGIAADFLTGGLTFGGGAAAGFLLGFIGGSGLQGLFNLIGQGNHKAVAPSHEFLDQLLSQAVLFYLAVAHYGRGQGAWRESDAARTWSHTVRAALDTRRQKLHDSWKQIASRAQDGNNHLHAEVAALMRESLVSQYPEAAGVLG
jgi:hypothetical protein